MDLKSVPVRLRRRLGGGIPAPSPAAGHVACNAPFTSMYLDPRGFVRACCMNDYQLLGNVTEERLTDIWHGGRAQELRRAMERHDLTIGCEFCKWQVDDGRADMAFARWFDDFPVTAPEPVWPVQLELSISQTCNLQCVMCNSEWSSSIRVQREGLPPLPKVYDDAFFEDLREFLPHLQRIKFLGGEPFLASETLRVMEMLVEMGLRTRCHVTTNGTQWTPRVERILDMVPVDVAVSLDAATAETYESIRIGSSWATVQEHLDRFQERAAANDTGVTVTYCLMANNWHEFGDFCLAADQRRIGCAVNTVTEPAHLSLLKQPTAELHRIVDELEATDRRIGASLGRSAKTWRDELRRLRAHLDSREHSAPVTGIDSRRLNPKFPRPFAGDDAPSETEPRGSADAATVTDRPVEELVAGLGPTATVLRLDATSTVVAVEPERPVLGVEPGRLIGASLGDLPMVLAEPAGGIASMDTIEVLPGAQVLEVGFGSGRWARVVVVNSRHGAPSQILLAEVDGPGGDQVSGSDG